VELDLNAKSSATVDHGNVIGLISGYKTADGVTHQMGDVWFSKSGDDQKAHPSAADVLAAPSAPVLPEAAHGGAATTALSTATTPDDGARVHHAAMAALHAAMRKAGEEDGSAPLL
jgi:hypothetical protein